MWTLPENIYMSSIDHTESRKAVRGKIDWGNSFNTGICIDSGAIYGTSLYEDDWFSTIFFSLQPFQGSVQLTQPHCPTAWWPLIKWNGSHGHRPAWPLRWLYSRAMKSVMNVLAFELWTLWTQHDGYREYWKNIFYSTTSQAIFQVIY